ncbi:MAG: glycoside hydrolase family 95 protein [Fermentimonas sp.]|nr:glycoside hydrolase family 95 protein [Fermentimonas sp.]
MTKNSIKYILILTGLTLLFICHIFKIYAIDYSNFSEYKYLTSNNTTEKIRVDKASERNTPFDNKWFDRAEFHFNHKVFTINKNLLWYKESANVWEEAIPLGNGRLGAMVFGGVADERIQLNENTLWDGYPLDPNNPEGSKALPEIQRMLFENKNNEAVSLAEKTMMGIPKGIRPYQSLGELWFDTPELYAENYTRCLDLSTAISKVTYSSNGVNYTREYFASAPDNVVVIRITSDQNNKVNLSLTLKREQDAIVEKLGEDGLILKGRISTKDNEGNSRGLSFAAQVKATVSSGSIRFKELIDNKPVLVIENSDTVTLYITGATNYPGMENLAKGIIEFSEDPVKKCSKTISGLQNKSYEQIRTDHIVDYKQYFERVDLDLGEVGKEIEILPTDERLLLARETGTPDAGLIATYFQFGRYLLISSSRPGGMPANLQGLWAWQMNPPWNSDFHTNINFQMNYWPAEVTNIPEMHLPLFDLMDMLIKPGERSAKIIYGAEGWVVHHLTDAWGFTAPADGPQGIWPMGAAWLTRHLWEHYCFTGDKEFLANRAWPVMKGAARFIIDFLVEAPLGTAYEGKLVTNPSYSPENAFILPNGEHSVFTYGSTMDIQIINDLLTNCIKTSLILDRDKDFRKVCEETLSRIPKTRISKKTGRIMEWAEDYEEVEPLHRHTSHLFGLHPGNQITINTPEYADAARKTLVARGDDGTGWGLAWKINMWTRLHDGDHAFKLLSVLLRDKTLPNLFDDHPPFQIDGNFGATAAIAEMLLQSHFENENGEFEIHLLPALPAALSKSGYIKGLRARGGFEVDIEWKNGSLTKATVHSIYGGNLHLKNSDLMITRKMCKNEIITFNSELQQIY